MTTKIKTSAEYGSEIKMPHVPKDLTADIVAEAYRRIAVNPVVVSGTIGNTSAGDSDFSQNIRTVWSQRDIDRKEKTRFTKTLTLQADKGAEGDVTYKCTSCTLPQEISNLLWDVESPSERKRAVVVKQKDKKGEEKQFVEIWDLRHKVKTIDVKALEKHGDIVGNDGQFGSLRWSQCEEYLLYIAEKKKPKTASFFDAKSSMEKDKGDIADDVAVKGEEYLHLESWGEQLVERHHTVICRLHISSSTVTVLTSVPDDYSPGQVLWGPDSEVVFVGWCHEPYRLGLKFCVERKSFLFKASFDGTNCEKLSEEGRAVRCPSFSPDLSRLVYLDTPEGGAHNQCSRLMMINWKKLPAIQEARTVVVDIVNSPYKSGYDPEREEFPGLYTWADLGSLRNWLKDNVHLLLTSYCRSASTIVLVNTDTKTVRRLYPGDRKCSCTLLDVRGHDALVACSWPNQPPVLMLGCLKPDKLEASRWVQLGSDQDNPPTNTCFDWELHVHHPKTLQSTHPSYLDPKTLQSVHPDYEYLSFDSILFLPAKDGDTDSKPPLVLFPHGGPHSTFDTSFQLNPAVFACCGFAVLCVNFRGSLGFGQDSINSLLGHIGDFDVKDCLLAMERVRKENLVDHKNTFVYGGSHGGFLAAHLIGQYPKEFKAASMRNPVINLTSMVGTSDIHDWIFTEAGLQFDYKSLANGDLLPKLWKASPINYIDNVKTPVMLNIGLKDLRVPPSQGLEYYKMLKARGVPVRCMTYPESNHSLSEVEVEADSLINSILWFAQHISDEDISQD